MRSNLSILSTAPLKCHAEVDALEHIHALYGVVEWVVRNNFLAGRSDCVNFACVADNRATRGLRTCQEIHR
jgi:hypothetical protein